MDRGRRRLEDAQSNHVGTTAAGVWELGRVNHKFASLLLARMSEQPPTDALGNDAFIYCQLPNVELRLRFKCVIKGWATITFLNDEFRAMDGSAGQRHRHG